MKSAIDVFLEKWNAAILPPLSEPIVVGLSGGVDSVLLCYFLKNNGHNVIAAHVNYNLRGIESIDDEGFVKAFCKKYNIPLEIASAFHEKSDENNIQQWARDIRYTFFKRVKEKYKASCICLAHHKDDWTETILFQFLRGSYAYYPIGIEEKRDDIIRPLLAVSKDEIVQMALGLGLKWREDSSNSKNDYYRNMLRNVVIPALKQQDEFWQNKLLTRHKHWSDTISFVEEYAAKELEGWVTTSKSDFIMKLELATHPHALFLIRHFLQQNGIEMQAEDILRLMNSIPGKFVVRGEYTALRERQAIRFTTKQSQEKDLFEFIHSPQSEVTIGKRKFILQELKEAEDLKTADKNCVYMDLQKLRFPLILRKWREGDSFVPFGMTGRKKLSDYLIQEKIEQRMKKNILVLCSGEEICWVVGYRSSELFKVTALTTSILKIRQE